MISNLRSEAGGEDFAARQNQSADAFLAAGDSSPAFVGQGDHAQHGGGAALGDAEARADLSAEALAKAEAGMAEMGEQFRDRGGEIYLPADN